MKKLFLVATTTAALAASAPAVGMREQPQAVKALIRRVFGGDAARAICIASHESGLDPRAQNGSNTGLFQVDKNTWDPSLNPRAIPIVGRIVWARMHDPAYNARLAYRIYARYGWGPWSTRGLCA